jgi:hypothetical protein
MFWIGYLEKTHLRSMACVFRRDYTPHAVFASFAFENSEILSIYSLGNSRFHLVAVFWGTVYRIFRVILSMSSALGRFEGFRGFVEMQLLMLFACIPLVSYM